MLYTGGMDARIRELTYTKNLILYRVRQAGKRSIQEIAQILRMCAPLFIEHVKKNPNMPHDRWSTYVHCV